MRRYLLPGYILFSVCFYANRFIMGWGSPGTTIYESDAPTWVRLSKDVVWVIFVAASTLSINWRTRPALSREHRKFLILTVLFCLWFLVSAFLHLFSFTVPDDVSLYWIRYPLEYIPIVWLFPFIVDEWRILGKTAVVATVIVFLFLIYELTSGRPTGFVTRYGSIFGSPNDYGTFCAIMIVGFLVYATNKQHAMLIGTLVFGLLLTISRSAFVGLFAGLSSLTYLRRMRVVVVTMIVVCGAGIATLVAISPDSDIKMLSAAADHFSGDQSALNRVIEIRSFVDSFDTNDERLSSFIPLLIGTDYFHVENWYFASVVRAGLPGLLLLFAVLISTIVRGWRFRKQSRVVAVGFGAVVTISVASMFIPYLDTFPTNFYLWLAIAVVWTASDQTGAVAVDDLSDGMTPSVTRGHETVPVS